MADVLDLMGDFFLQTIFFIGVVVLLLLAISSFSNTDIFKSYYAKDLGLTTSALYASKGITSINYDKTDQKLRYSFKFSPSALLVSSSEDDSFYNILNFETGNSNNDASTNDASQKDAKKSIDTYEKNLDWDTRKVYGVTQGIDLKESLFINPYSLFFLKDDSEITISNNLLVSGRCSDSKSSFIKKQTTIKLIDKDNFLSEQVKKELSNNASLLKKELIIEIVNNDGSIKQGGKIISGSSTVIVVEEFSNLVLVNKVTCLLSNFLQDSSVIFGDSTKSQDSSQKASQKASQGSSQGSSQKASPHPQPSKKQSNESLKKDKEVIKLKLIIPKEKPGLNLEASLKKTFLLLLT